jgi:serine/threonine protein kinase
MSDEHSLPSIREEQIFSKARTLPVAARAAYLDRVCGADHKLRALVEALLLCDGKEDLLAKASPIFQPCSTAGEAIGSSIGRYKLLEIIGEGGGGVVYRAEQDGPLHLQVALKIIKPGIHTKQQLRRFEAERHALAKMNSSHFAKVLDAGTADDGRAYFVMERVEGKTITAYVDDKELTLSQRLDLFVKVCKAIHDAHLKGYIHRDIKPSNILVTTESGEPVPKVIDFGIAKPTVGEPKLNEELTTTTGQFIGTPPYMSPEQSGAGSKESDRRTDIYSLGLLLHELLLGCLPFTLDGLSRDDQLRTNREKKPQLPSTKFKSLPEKEMLRIAHTRKTEPSRLVDALRGGLDRIVMRCLEKQRDDRYDTANSLAVDIQRWSNNQAPAGELTSSLGQPLASPPVAQARSPGSTSPPPPSAAHPVTSASAEPITSPQTKKRTPSPRRKKHRKKVRRRNAKKPPAEIPRRGNQSWADWFAGMSLDEIRPQIVAAMGSTRAKELLKELLEPDTTVVIAHKLVWSIIPEYFTFYVSEQVPEKIKRAVSDIINEDFSLRQQVVANLRATDYDYLFWSSVWFHRVAKYYGDNLAIILAEDLIRSQTTLRFFQGARQFDLSIIMTLIHGLRALRWIQHPSVKLAVTSVVEICVMNEFAKLKEALANESHRKLVLDFWKLAPKYMTIEQVEKLERFLTQNKVIRPPNPKYNIHVPPPDVPRKFHLLTLAQTKRLLKEHSQSRPISGKIRPPLLVFGGK